MAPSVASIPAHSPVPQTALPQATAPGRDRAAQRRDEAALPRDEAGSRRESPEFRPETGTAAPAPARQPGFRFEYVDNSQVMQVQDSKGILIYQVPSKGQLALLKATEAAPSQVDTRA